MIVFTYYYRMPSFNQLAEIMRTMRKGSILSPLIIICVVVLLVTIPAISFGNVLIQYAAMGLFIICVLVTLGAFIYFALTDPDKIRTEEHTETMRALDLIGDAENMPGTTAGHVVALANPRRTKEFDAIDLPLDAPTQTPLRNNKKLV